MSIRSIGRAWAVYETNVLGSALPHEIRDSRQAFYFGALMFYRCMFGERVPDDIAVDRERLQGLYNELLDYQCLLEFEADMEER